MPTFNPINDYRIFDRTVTLTLTTAAGITQTVANCTISPLTRNQIEAAGIVGEDKRTRNFSLPVPNLSGIVPKNGDILNDGSDNWIILIADLRTTGVRYLCTCQAQLSAN